ncbi:alpha/beta fold hydrolase [Ferruginibacter sp. SUN106]|uniref:alpha/beta fold hydrolase n=1 Tax=Ferruginibacter sp. SUN106 TaxID=2978348 RepID=UPI003D36B882
MKPVVLFLFFLSCIIQRSLAQNYTPSIEPCPCLIKIDSGLVSKCGYLVVPENRQKPAGRQIKIPFVSARKPEQDAAKNFTLYTTGGPGYSTIANFDSIRYRSDFLKFGGFIAFDQRGTKLSQPCLQCDEINVAIKRAYKENLSKDSLELDAVKKCRNRLATQGIDLSAYNTIESAADINDLRLALHLDSLNLLGISYSGGLMLTVVRNHPAAVKSLILNSPLPGYANYEEDALFNINEALNQVFDNCEKDSGNNLQYQNLRERFHQYFTAINGKVFTIAYAEKDTHDSLQLHYTKNELLDAVINRINNSQLKTVPFVINELINGNHKKYITEVLDDNFSGNGNLSHGMRYSVYCSEQIAYANKALVKKQELMLPWLSGYPFNNVNHAICSCWNVKPEPPVAKTAVYSTIPALISAGDADPWCRPFYNRLIKRYMPNSQLLIIHNRAHGSGFGVDGIDFVKMFMENPYKKLISTSKNVIVE